MTQAERPQRLAVQDAWLAVHEPELLKEVEESAQALAAANTLTGAQRERAHSVALPRHQQAKWHYAEARKRVPLPERPQGDPYA